MPSLFIKKGKPSRLVISIHKLKRYDTSYSFKETYFLDRDIFFRYMCLLKGMIQINKQDIVGLL